MIKVLVTGGAGFIGSHVVDALVARRHKVLVVDDLSTGRADNIPPGVDLVRMDIRSPSVKDVFRGYRPEVVFHLAAQKNVRTSLEQPVFDAEVNIHGSLNVLDQAKRFHAKQFIFSSTCGVYGSARLLPTRESEPANPESPYCIAKRTIEQYLEFFHGTFGMRTASLRYANVYGPRQDPKGEAGVVAVFFENFLKNQPLIIHGDGRQTRDYVYVDDVVRANMLALQRRAQGIFNIGTGRQTSVNALAKRMREMTSSRSAIRHGRAIDGELRRSAVDTRAARRALAWKSEIEIDLGLRRTAEWFGHAFADGRKTPKGRKP